MARDRLSALAVCCALGGLAALCWCARIGCIVGVLGGSCDVVHPMLVCDELVGVGCLYMIYGHGGCIQALVLQNDIHIPLVCNKCEPDKTSGRVFLW